MTNLHDQLFPPAFPRPLTTRLLTQASFRLVKGSLHKMQTKKAMRVETIRHTLGMDLPSNVTTLIRGNKSYNMNGGDHAICRQVAFFGQQQFDDFFAWAANPLISEYRGSVWWLGEFAPCGTCCQRLRQESACVQRATLQLN